jgi:hypothetical protein
MNEKHPAESTDLIKNPPGSFEADFIQKRTAVVAVLNVSCHARRRRAAFPLKNKKDCSGI